VLVQCENKTFPQFDAVIHKVSDLVSRVVSKKKASPVTERLWKWLHRW